MKKIIILIGLCFILLKANAQSQKSIVIEIDPLSYTYKGYSVESAFSINKNRFFIEVVKFGEIPEFILGNNKFNEKRFVLGIGYSYFIKSHQKGLFVGGDISNSYSTYKLLVNNTTQNVETFRIGPRIGYTFSPFKKLPNLILSPWISPRYALNIKDINISNETLKRNSFDFVGAIHIGYKFSLNKK